MIEEKWIAIQGSPRLGRNTDMLIDYYIEELQEKGRRVDKIILSQIEQNICNGCEWCIKNKVCHYNDEMSIIIEKIQNAKGIILGSPSYHYNVTPYMKIFLDRLFVLFNFGNGGWTSQLDLKGIKAIIIGACAGPDSSSMGYTMEAMKRVMLDHGVEVIIEEHYYGTKRNPVENNMEIRNNIIVKLDEVFN